MHDEILAPPDKNENLLPPDASIFVLEVSLVRRATAITNHIFFLSSRVRQPLRINRFVACEQNFYHLDFPIVSFTIGLNRQDCRIINIKKTNRHKKFYYT